MGTGGQNVPGHSVPIGSEQATNPLRWDASLRRRLLPAARGHRPSFPITPSKPRGDARLPCGTASGSHRATLIPERHHPPERHRYKTAQRRPALKALY